MIGRTISHYTIVERLGEGGMGVVYKAEDLKLGRTVAVKFLPQSNPANREARDRFSREAQSASALNHPNICTIYGIDEVEGELFIIMEYIEGRSLRKAIDAGPLSIAEIIHIAQNIAEGLRAAHGKKIVHKDIKPENIIITREGVAKLVDFGLARAGETSSGSGSGILAGTMAYMSPEQLQGGQVSHLTDLWSMGIVLYEAVTGRRPFASEYEQAVMYAIAHEKHRPAASLRAGVPPRLEKLIDRCLEKSPDARIPDARAILDELRKIEHGSTVRETGTKSIAVLPFADISPERDNMYISDGLTEEIIANLSQLRKVKIISRTSVMQYERAGKSMKTIASELGVQYVLEGSVRKFGSDLRITTQLVDAKEDATVWAEKYDGTTDEILDIQENVAARIVKALQVRLTPDERQNLRRRATDNTEAYQLYLKGRYFWSKRNREALETAIRYFEEAIEKDPRYALAWAGIADSWFLMSDYSNLSRKETHPKARMAVEKALALDDKLAEAHASLAGLIMLSDWDWAGAEREYKLAISLNPNYATTHHWYAEWLSFQGRIGQALSEISLAEELDPVSPAIARDKGVILYYARDYDGAIEHAMKAMELDRGFSHAHRLLSLAYQGKGMFEEAIAENKKWADMLGNGVEASISLAQCYAAAGRKSEALELIAGLDPKELEGGNLYRGIALVYAALGENDVAFTWLEGAYERWAESLSTLKIDPKLDPLRGDPRFAALLKKVGLGT